jgi:ComF family protein
MKSLWYFLREYVFPRGCGICGNILISKTESWYGLCDECRKSLDFEKIDRCDLCGRPLISEIGRCLQCRNSAETEPPSCDRIISLYPYSDKYQKLLSSFKFGKSLGTGHFLAEKIVEALKLFPPDEVKDAVFIPVPPRPGKIRKTGWDQIVCLTKLIGQRQESPKIVHCLKRKTSQSQKKLGRKDRKANLKGRILAKDLVPENCIIFDDVITTGSTIDACAAALKLAGAKQVYGICLFYD